MWTISRDSGALAYVQSPGTATPRGDLSSSATPASDTAGLDRRGGQRPPPNPPPTLLGGGKVRGGIHGCVCQLRHESVPSVEGEVVAALVGAGPLLAQLHQDVVEERRRAEPVQLRRQPLRPEGLVHQHEVLDRLLRLTDPARRLEPHPPAGLLE